MICPHCNTSAHVENVFADAAGTTRRGWCPECEVALTEVSFVVYTAPKHGEGARALSRKLKEGRLRVELKEATPERAASPANGSTQAVD